MVLSFSPNNTIYQGAIVVAMVAGIVRIIMRRSQNPGEQHYLTSAMIKKKKNKPLPNKLSLSDNKKKRSADSFFDDVFTVVRKIPKGRVTSYGAIAHYLGTKLSARMVGWAMNAAASATKPVPAHRVVNRNGMLSGKHHFSTPTLMEDLLKKEGIKVKDDVIINFKQHYWDPSEELG